MKKIIFGNGLNGPKKSKLSLVSISMSYMATIHGRVYRIVAMPSMANCPALFCTSMDQAKHSCHAWGLEHISEGIVYTLKQTFLNKVLAGIMSWGGIVYQFRNDGDLLRYAIKGPESTVEFTEIRHDDEVDNEVSILKIVDSNLVVIRKDEGFFTPVRVIGQIRWYLMFCETDSLCPASETIETLELAAALVKMKNKGIFQEGEAYLCDDIKEYNKVTERKLP